ncbi:hypothetical protein CPB86DRAFT_816821 [Serendipita vermifera]|nr:hypothetical protein CPB86DRAFT_816821 [Serendipita vermifera]
MIPHSAIVFKGITVELSDEDDRSLTDIIHLILELSSNGNVISRVDLLSLESDPGTWETHENPSLGEITEELLISVWLELEDNERQLVGFTKIQGKELHNAMGNHYRKTLMRQGKYPTLTLKTKIANVESIQKSTQVSGNKRAHSNEDIKKMLEGAVAMYGEFTRSENIASLTQAISQFETVVEFLPQDSHELPIALSILGSCLGKRFEQLGRVADINGSVARLTATVELLPDSHPNKPSHLSNLATCLKTRFDRLGNITDLDDAISRLEAAANLVPEKDTLRPKYLHDLASTLRTRFGRLGKLADLNDAISRYRIAVNLTPNNRPNKLAYLTDLGRCLITRFQRLSNVADIEEAISRHQTAVDLAPDRNPHKHHYLMDLGVSLVMRFEKLGNLIDLSDGISRQQAAVDLTPDNDPTKPNSLTSLGMCLRVRFNRAGNLDDINNAITRQQAALDLTPDSRPEKPGYLAQLGNTLMTRFSRLGNIADINDAISRIQAAANPMPENESHPPNPIWLNYLGICLQKRFEQFGTLSDIDEAISHQQATVDSDPTNPYYLNTLGVSLLTRFNRSRNLEDISDAILRQQAAVDLTADNVPNKPAYLANLGDYLQLRFDQLGKLSDLNDAISRHQLAVDLATDGHPEKPIYLTSLGSALRARFEHLGNLADIDNAISRQQTAVNLTSDSQSNKAGHFLDLSRSFCVRFRRFNHYSDAEAAISSAAAATSPVGPLLTRFAAVEVWISVASLINHHSLLDAYECATRLIPQVAWLDLPIKDHHQYLVDVGQITRNAVAAAISAEQYDKALEWLEQGRSIVYNQILQLRTPVAQLLDVNSVLANRLLHVSRLLEQGSQPGSLPRRILQSMEEEECQYQALKTERESIIEEVRSLPGFENFLKPPSLSYLLGAAQDGPVVVLNTSRERCDALAIIDGLDEVIHIPLPIITLDRVNKLQDELKDLLSSSGIRMRSERAVHAAKDGGDNEHCRYIVAELWTGIVKPPHPDTLPRIWWCTTGPLAFLPIHAAGIYSSDSTDSQISDYVISSYTPTLSALLESRKQTMDSSFKLLSVIQGSAPGAPSMPNTKEELNKIRHHLVGRIHVVLEDQEGTKARVIKAMDECNWLHLACQGVQKPEKPTKSSLILQDGHLTLDEIIRLNLPNVEFAFLSACQTNIGDKSLSEEAIHIAQGMLLAGCRGVVATTWSINDELAPEITNQFYAHIMKDQERPDSRNAAEALHLSVQELRKKPGVVFTDWIPTIVFKDIKVKLSDRDDRSLADIIHLILELTSNGNLLAKVDLLSLESGPGTWETNESPDLGEITGQLMVSVWLELEDNERQLVGFTEIEGKELYNAIGSRYEKTLMHHGDYPSLFLRTKVAGIECIQESMSKASQQRAPSGGDINRMIDGAIDLYNDFDRLGNMTSLSQAILQCEIAIELLPRDDPRSPRCLNNLGTCLVRRFEQLGQVTDINDAVARFTAAVELTPDDHPLKPTYLASLGNTLQVRFQLLGNPADINNAVSQCQNAVNHIPDNRPDKAVYLFGLGICLIARAQGLGDPADIDDAILHQRAAVDLAPDGSPHRPDYLNGLGVSLSIRFERLGNLSDLNDAISRQLMAVDLRQDGHPAKSKYLTSLGNSLLTRFNRTGNLDDMTNAISRQQEAVDLISEGHPDKPAYLNSLGASLFIRFFRLGNILDIDEAISIQRLAVRLTSDSHSQKPKYLSNLGTSLQTRFERFGNSSDINDAISCKQAAVDLASTSNPYRALYLSNLGISLQIRFLQLSNPVDINNAISKQQAAVDLTPDGHPNKPSYLSDLGNSFVRRFDELGEFSDLDDGISRHQDAVNLTPDDHHSKPSYLTNLGSSFRIRFEHRKNLDDIENAISYQEAAVNLTSDDQPDKARHLLLLSRSFWKRFCHLDHISDAEAAIHLSSTAAMSPYGPPMTRFSAAKVWISAASYIDHHTLLSAYECALCLIPLVAWLGLSIKTRHQHLIDIGGIARNAAAAAISVERYDKALEWLEQGRSIVWTQILQLRTPVDQLLDVHPDLANRLLHVSRLLDGGNEPGKFPEGLLQSMEEEEHRHRALATERESIIEEVRSLPGFENFLKPPTLAHLTGAACDGPVVVLNIARERCDALAIIDGLEEVIHIPLPNITLSRVNKLQDELKELLRSSGIRMRGERAARRIKTESDDEGCAHILAELWTGIVKPPHPDTLPRIWWCTTGPLAFLPIHAAGVYSSGSTDSQISDYVISSYTPTLSTLLESRKTAKDSSFKLLSVIQGSAPGASSIPNTKEELKIIRSHLVGRTHVVLEDQEGTKARVMKAMSGCNWLHLACHGVQKIDEPIKSALILEDGHLTLDEIIRLNLPNAEFAFLSACQTTTGDEKLSEEAVHIAGGVLLAGYRGVVATMWSIKDDLAPEVTDKFYAHVMRGEERPDCKNAAEALHLSVQELKKKPGVVLTDWIPFVHLGV